jgi:hypothetical protein
MRAAARYCLATVAIISALLVIPKLAFADGLTGSVDVTWLATSTGVITTGTDTVGSVLTCPGPASAFCSPSIASFLGSAPVSWAFGVDSSSITFKSSAPDGAFFLPDAFNGFDFSGLTFASGKTLAGFDLSSSGFGSGLTNSDVTFGSDFIEVNLQDLPVNGTFTLDLVSTPEPGTLGLLGLALVGLAALTWLRRRSDSLA